MYCLNLFLSRLQNDHFKKVKNFDPRFLSKIWNLFQVQKQAFLDFQMVILKSRKIRIFAKGLPTIFVKYLKFLPSAVLCRIGLDILFKNDLQGKQPFLEYKMVILKKLKNSHFPKGVNQRFWSKIWNFSQVLFSVE